MYTGETPEDRNAIDWEDPFFAAIKRADATQGVDDSRPVPDRTTTTEKWEIDQA